MSGVLDSWRRAGLNVLDLTDNCVRKIGHGKASLGRGLRELGPWIAWVIPLREAFDVREEAGVLVGHLHEPGNAQAGNLLHR